MEEKAKEAYESPEMKVLYVNTEDPIAVSPTFTENLGWNPDPEPTPAVYDGDIWVNF